MSKPVCFDFFCGLGGWTKGFLAEGYDCYGFDVERHQYGEKKYPAQLILQDVLTFDGRQAKDAACLVASPPCQEFSYMAMPWTRAKQIAGGFRGEVPFPEGYTGSLTTQDLTALFDACFRIQLEASAAAGRIIPLIVENVKGAQPWVGRARAHYGSYYLWGDVEDVGGRVVAKSARPVFGETVRAARRGGKNSGGSWFNEAHNTESGTGQNPVTGQKGLTNLHFFEQTGLPSPSFHGAEHEASVQRAVLAREGIKQRGSGAAWFDTGICSLPSGSRGIKEQKDGLPGYGGGFGWDGTAARRMSSHSPARKAASAQIAEIPFDLARYIARSFKP